MHCNSVGRQDCPFLKATLNYEYPYLAKDLTEKSVRDIIKTNLKKAQMRTLSGKDSRDEPPRLKAALAETGTGYRLGAARPKGIP